MFSFGLGFPQSMGDSQQYDFYQMGYYVDDQGRTVDFYE